VRGEDQVTSLAMRELPPVRGCTEPARHVVMLAQSVSQERCSVNSSGVELDRLFQAEVAFRTRKRSPDDHGRKSHFNDMLI
jgi:hypothetical protein